VPSRQDVEEYQNLRSTVNELVGRINGRFGTVDFVPIHFMHKSLQFNELVSLYAVSDVCLVTSTRDGMNLVSRVFLILMLLLSWVAFAFAVLFWLALIGAGRTRTRGCRE
jgi:trehalose-6-phosphate synthase